MKDLIHPSIEQILRVHKRVLEKDGGLSGVREMSLFESAIAAPQATFGGEPILTDPVEVAAAYLFYLCRNHPFLDGNKRVALATCLVFMRLNALEPREDSEAWEALVLDVAASKLDRVETTERLRLLVANES